MKTHKPAMIWNEEYGLSYAKADADRRGSSFIFYPELKRLGLLRRSISMLSIGGGFGALEVMAARDLRVKLGFIDPSPNLFEGFMSSAEKAGVRDLIRESHSGEFKTFQSSFTYDLIVAIHSWYYIGCDSAQLAKALDLLNPGGALYIALSSREDWDAELKALLHGENPLTLEDVSEWANSMNSPNEIVCAETQVPVERWLVNGGLTEEAKAKISYLSRKDWPVLPDDIKKKALEIVQRKAKNRFLKSRPGGVIFKKQAF